jgi:hypothetical protein
MSETIASLKVRAADLHQELISEDAAAIARVDAVGAGLDRARDLDTARSVIAREEGHRTWNDLMEATGQKMIEERDLHRWFGVHLNNTTWARFDAGDPNADSDVRGREGLLYGAYASAYHWMQVGNPINQARAEHLIARAAIRVGRPELGLHHATRCLELASAHSDLAEAWDLGFAHEAIARAHAALGRPDLAKDHRSKVRGIIAEMTDEDDRAVLENELTNGEWFDIEG